jgi:SAM-dependent methyltransferase
MPTERNVVPRFDHLTYRGNSKHSRYGWLRLTPAFSVHLIQENVRGLPNGARVLDPFSGTGTTALVCAEEGVHAETTDINPFLLWLGRAKCASYSADDLLEARRVSEDVLRAIRSANGVQPWVPPLFQIEKWWGAPILEKVGKARAVIEDKKEQIGGSALDLLKVAFCRMMIETANVSFGHQSMSFKQPDNQLMLEMPINSSEIVASSWSDAAESILKAAASPIPVRARFVKCDARSLTRELEPDAFDCVITSPPYPNRMSYIRELRPYMYWLGYLDDARQAGELDWEAIGGTWGCATSNLMKWSRPDGLEVPYEGFENILSAIANANVQSGPVLSRYVEKYFCDMVGHVSELFRVVRPGGSVHYVVGNSKFYEVMLPVEGIFASLFSAAGFVETKVETIRKRTSKKELFEYIVHAKKLVR